MNNTETDMNLSDEQRDLKDVQKHMEDSRRFRVLSKRFDNLSTTRARQFLTALGISSDQDDYPLSAIVDMLEQRKIP